MERIIKAMETKYMNETLEFVEDVFTKWSDNEEGRLVRALVKEIREKDLYEPELELIMVNEDDEVIGYAMFSKFYLMGENQEKLFENDLLILSPVAVKTELQRQHISKEMIEFGFEKAKEMGYKAVIVEGNPNNYNSRGFMTSADFGIVAGKSVDIPDVKCLMVKELKVGTLQPISGTVEYDCYEALH